MGTIRLPTPSVVVCTVNPRRPAPLEQLGAPGTLSVHDSSHPKHPAGQGAINGKQSAKCSPNFIFCVAVQPDNAIGVSLLKQKPFHPPSNTTSSKSSCSQPRRTSRKARYTSTTPTPLGIRVRQSRQEDEPEPALRLCGQPSVSEDVTKSRAAWQRTTRLLCGNVEDAKSSGISPRYARDCKSAIHIRTRSENH